MKRTPHTPTHTEDDMEMFTVEPLTPTTPSAPGEVQRIDEKIKKGQSDAKSSNNTTTRAQFRWLIGQCRHELLYMSFAIIAIIVASGINLSIPFFVGKLIDSIQTLVKGKSELYLLVGTLGILVLFMSVFNGLRHYFIVITAERIVVRLRGELFRKVIEQDIAFFDVHKTGELMNRLSSDADVLRMTVTVNVETGIRCILDSIGCIVILVALSWKLLLIMLLVVPVVAVGAVIYLRFVGGLSRDVQDELATASEIAQETISNIRSVRSLAKENKQVRFYEDNINQAYNRAKHLTLAAASFTGGMMLAAGICILLVVAYGGTMVLNGELSTGQLTSFVLYSGFIAMSLSTGSGVYFEFLKALGATERVYSIITRIPTIPISHENKIVNPNEIVNHVISEDDSDEDEIDSTMRGELSFHDVSFSYPTRGEKKVLTDFNLDLIPGKVVALVGESGGGKSTCIQLLQRFYDPDSGYITLDGVDIKELDPTFLRKNIGVVSQEPFLFGTSVRENIKYAKDTVGDDQVFEAARQANAHQFIQQFPNGYDTLVGERGTQLSGGQKQRVAIAQAILKKPKILLLDEATSALDSESEHLVQMALERLMKGRTVLVIAHRLSTVKNADLVCVISKGRIVERGTHNELVKQNGMYKQLVEKQLLSEDSQSK
ncbi:ABC transporter B family member [Acrasis kona]|uniref:ABC transporter B family member n=1 Tax=Acrasis kona TaxID=1008807 RepID=A0AAW2Z214_9EUKA